MNQNGAHEHRTVVNNNNNKSFTKKKNIENEMRCVL